MDILYPKIPQLSTKIFHSDKKFLSERAEIFSLHLLVPNLLTKGKEEKRKDLPKNAIIITFSQSLHQLPSEGFLPCGEGKWGSAKALLFFCTE